MSRMVRMTSDDPLTPEDMDELRHLSGMPDDQIDTSDIPEKTSQIPVRSTRKGCTF